MWMKIDEDGGVKRRKEENYEVEAGNQWYSSQPNNPYTKCNELKLCHTATHQVRVSPLSFSLKLSRLGASLVSKGICFHTLGPVYLRFLLVAVRFVFGIFSSIDIGACIRTYIGKLMGLAHSVIINLYSSMLDVPYM